MEQAPYAGEEYAVNGGDLDSKFGEQGHDDELRKRQKAAG